MGKKENPDQKLDRNLILLGVKLIQRILFKIFNYFLKTNYYFCSYPAVDFDNGNIQIIDDIYSFFYEDDYDLLKLITNSNDNKIITNVIR